MRLLKFKFLSLSTLLTLSTFGYAQRTATSPARINIANGFKIDLLHSVPMEKQGSWVAMCMDDKQRLIVSDQYGGIYRFPIPKPGKNIDPKSIQQITYATERPGAGNPTEAQKKLPQIGHAQGLCYVFDSLYVVVNSRSSVTGAGVFRLLDTDGHGQETGRNRRRAWAPRHLPGP